MSKNSEKFVKDISFTQNRELSWLKFDERVLQEAEDETVPIMERLKFISIFTSNLDEFFMVRVGSLFDMSQMSPDDLDNKTGLTPVGQLKEIYKQIPHLMESRDKIYSSVMEGLGKYGILDLKSQDLTKEEIDFVSAYFKNFVMPILSPQVIDKSHPFPHLLNKALYIAALLKGKKDKTYLGLIPVPQTLPAILSMPTDKRRFMRMETIISMFCNGLFGTYTVENAGTISVTRNADISFDEEKFDDEDIDYPEKMSMLLKKRGRLAPVRLEAEKGLDKDVVEELLDRLDIDKSQAYFTSSPLNMKYVFDLEKKLKDEKFEDIYYKPYTPQWPVDLDPKRSITSQVEEKDRLLFYPYDSMDPFLKLLKEASEDENVISVKITIYRLASASKVAQELCRAAENGKDVTVLMELRARFDEANNIAWAERLEQAGCRVMYGIENYKCHSKICLITKRKGDGLEYITQIGTGNYNEKTSSMYTDLSLLTANEKIGKDATAFFQNMLISNLEGDYERLLVAPKGLKPGLIRLIDEEIKKGPAGRIRIKANSFTERDIIDKLSQASKAGTKVEFILRGICCLKPGIEGKTDNISVTSIVGRYLEHSRIYCFGEGEDTKIYISSADLMTRNISRRVEIACPIYDKDIKNTLLEMLDIMFKDNIKARSLGNDGIYRKKDSENTEKINSQEYFLEHSIHKPFVPKEKAKVQEVRKQETKEHNKKSIFEKISDMFKKK